MQVLSGDDRGQPVSEHYLAAVVLAFLRLPMLNDGFMLQSRTARRSLLWPRIQVPPN